MFGNLGDQRKGSVLAGFGAGLAVVLAGAVAAWALTHQPSNEELPPKYVIDQAAAEAVEMGELHPTSADWVVTTRKAASSANQGTTVDSNTKLYFVLLRGNFVGHNLSFPKGASPPTGTELELVFDADTQGIGDLGLGQHTEDISKYGTPHSFLQALQKSINQAKNK